MLKWVKKQSIGVVLVLGLLGMALSSSLQTTTAAANPDTTPPSSVQALTATPAAAKRVQLEWGKSTDNVGVDHYAVYQDGNFVANVPDGGGTTFTYDLINLNPGTTYNFVVKAVDAAGNISTANATATATTPASSDTVAPGAITGLAAQAISVSKVKLTWNAGTDNVGVTDYQVLQDGSPVAVVRDNGAAGYSYYRTGLNPFTSYTFEVVAADKEGNVSTGNNTVSVTTLAADTQAPTAPTSLTATYVGSNEVRLAWQASTDNVAVTKYNIYRSDSGGAFQLITGTNIAGYTNMGLAGNTNYSFKIAAVDPANNESAYSNTISVTTTIDSTEPKIMAYEPAADEIDIGQALPIKIYFDDALNTATVTGSTVYLRDSLNNPVTATVSYSSGLSVITLTPSASLSAGQKYTVYVTGGGSGLKNTANISLAQNFSWSFTVGSSSFTIAHGKFTDNTSKCRLCHTLHNGSSRGLIKESTQTGMCFTCHDGTAATNNIASVFAADSGNITYHPVKDTEGAKGQLIRCSDCHNPHGNHNIATGTYYPKLLKAFNGTGYVNQGPEFCLACHGSSDRNWSPVYWQNTLGDHTNANAAHFDSSKPALQPSSGSKVTCVMCHDKHASSNNRLIREDQGTEDTLCSRCHNNTANSLSSRNIIAEFNRTGSRHNIFDADQGDGSKVECRSCHGPHTVGPVRHTTGLNVSDISDPDDTYKFFTKAAGPRNTLGTLSEFCLKCHDGGPPVKNMSTTVQVPYTVQFPNNPAVLFTSNNTGWNKSPFTGSGHFTGANRVDCDLCHEQHGSDYARLQARAEDTTTVNGICLYCHAGNAGYPAALNIKTEMTKTYQHPSLTVSGKHTDTENYNDLAVANRHAECVDCHDPHSAAPDTTTTPPARSNILKNTSGVSVGARPAWTSLAPTSGLYVFKSAIDNQYELCYKCHSSYSATAGTAPTRDIAKEFNPANKAFHSVEADSPNAKGIFVAGYSATSRLWCSDCHGREGGGSPRGPHGSNNPKILKGLYDTTTGSGNSTHLCFNCHVYGAYAVGNGAYRTNNNTGFYNGSRGNLHDYHTRRLGSIKCQWCHSGVVHGLDSNKHLIINVNLEAPPYETSISRLKTYVENSGSYNTGNCTTNSSAQCYRHGS